MAMNGMTDDPVNGRFATRFPARNGLAGQLWTLFWLLALLQVVDLATTYFAIVTKVAHEGNAFLTGLVFTPLAPVLKAFALVFLAILIVRSTNGGRPAPARLLVAARVTVVLYLAIVLNNVIVLRPH